MTLGMRRSDVFTAMRYREQYTVVIVLNPIFTKTGKLWETCGVTSHWLPHDVMLSS